MARLIYSAISSLDGYTEDRNGKFNRATLARGSGNTDWTKWTGT